MIRVLPLSLWYDADTINAAAFAGALTIASGSGADVITTQSGDNLSVDAGAGADGITAVGAQLTSADTIDGGAATDTITLSADAATIVDADFDNISMLKDSNCRWREQRDAGTKADDSGLATVTGGDDADTINAAAFAGALTIASGAGADVITTQSGSYSVSVDAGAGNDGITTVGHTTHLN